MALKEFLITASNRLMELITVIAKDSDILWVVAPLLIATIIMFIYFQKYKYEELGWNSAVANSLVTLFISIALLRYIYFMTSPASVLNFTIYFARTCMVLILFFITFIVLIVNFEHLLPKKLAYHISSPLTMNLISYVIISFVYSSLKFDWLTFVILLFMFIMFRAILYIIQYPLDELFDYLEATKRKEAIIEEKVQKTKKKLEKKLMKKGID